MWKRVYKRSCKNVIAHLHALVHAFFCVYLPRPASLPLCFNIRLLKQTSIAAATPLLPALPNLPLLTNFLPPSLPKARATLVPGAESIKGEKESKNSPFQEVSAPLFKQCATVLPAFFVLLSLNNVQMYWLLSLYSCCLCLIVTVGIVYKNVCLAVVGRFM